MPKTFQHYDILGREITMGSHVAFSVTNSMYVGSVVKLSEKMIRVKNIRDRSKYNKGDLKYPSDCVLLDGPHLTMFLLKNSA